MSTKCAGLAKKLGYTNIKVMLKGAPGWKKSGHTLVASPQFIREGNIVLVDLRPQEQAAAGYIPRAVNIPFDQLEEMEDEFPVNTSAPIVLYGNNVNEAMKMLKEWGYSKVSLVEGGFAQWQDSGNEVAVGAPASEINWVRKLGKGEVSIADFTKAVKNHPADKIVLDVRNQEETAEGMLPNAVNIPLDQIEARIAELPKEKEIFVHCTTGARAEMAYDALKKAGYNAKFVVANVSVDGEDYEITE